jgi:enolase
MATKTKKGTVRYFNIKSVYGVETVDQLNEIDFKTYKEFLIELKRLKKEYQICGMNVYLSNKCTKDWNK